jgi:hypothetical protein
VSAPLKPFKSPTARNSSGSSGNSARNSGSSRSCGGGGGGGGGGHARGGGGQDGGEIPIPRDALTYPSPTHHRTDQLLQAPVPPALIMRGREEDEDGDDGQGPRHALDGGSSLASLASTTTSLTSSQQRRCSTIGVLAAKHGIHYDKNAAALAAAAAAASGPESGGALPAGRMTKGAREAAERRARGRRRQEAVSEAGKTLDRQSETLDSMRAQTAALSDAVSDILRALRVQEREQAAQADQAASMATLNCMAMVGRV